MSSSIFFRFKSQKEPLMITFDGASLSVFEVKRDIIAISKLGDGTDFDLDIYSADGQEKYDDDTTQIPRATTVIARRQPPRKPGAGSAARYVTGKMPVNAKNARRIESKTTAPSSSNTPGANPMIGGGKEMSEEEKLQALFSANEQSWRADQETMSHKPVVRSYNKAAVPDKPLPPGYICHRCGEKGHWIQACPTNDDPKFDNRPKFKRTTGIPRSFLKVVEKPTEVGEDGKVDNSLLPKGVMYTANGEWVVAEPDNATWEKIQEKNAVAAEKAKEAASNEQELRDRGLECTLHNGIFVDPVKTPCCDHTYCRKCIEDALLDNDLECPNCGTPNVPIDDLTPDDDVVAKVKAYEDEKKAEKLQKQDKANESSTTADQSPKKEDVNPTTAPEIKVNDGNSAASTPNSKKRSADEQLPNDRKPSNPATAMAKSNSNQGTPTPNQSSSNTPQPPTAPAADLAEFQRQMQAMSASMAGVQNGMPAMMNPMMMPGFNPAMMGMNMNMPMNPAMMNMGMGMPNMPNFNNMNGGGNMNGWNGNGMGQGNWQGGNGRGGMQGGGNDSAYMRQPINPNRHRGRQNRPRSTDYRQI